MNKTILPGCASTAAALHIAAITGKWGAPPLHSRTRRLQRRLPLILLRCALKARNHHQQALRLRPRQRLRYLYQLYL